MRLLNTKSFELEKFTHDTIPRKYAILSHIWGKEEDEIHFRDVQEGRIKEAQGRPTKLEGCCRVANDDGYDYIWVDTCCIDNKNSVELQEAINSMYRWYENAAICYAFLSDVPTDDKNPWDPNSKFSSSRWFERGWTLQELLAPPRLRFYNCDWHYLGTKGDLCAIVEKATLIPSLHLLGIKALREASVAQRMSWAAKRVTKMPEDRAYSLLGIFHVSMPMIYGEGSEKAFARLQELIMKEIGDDSILAWGFGQTESSPESFIESAPGRILAKSPADFAESGHIQAREYTTRDSFDKFGGSLRLRVPLFKQAPDTVFGLLKCGDSDQVVGIPLANISSGASDEYIRPQARRPMLVPKSEAEFPRTNIVVRTEHENRTLVAGSRRYWFNIQGSVEMGLELIDVEPRSCWRKEEALIEAAVISREDAKQRTFVRFRHKAREVDDFLVILELDSEGSQSPVVARCHVMTCDRDTSIKAVGESYSRFRPEAIDKQSASNGVVNLQVITEDVQEETMFFLRTVPLPSPPEVTYSASKELQILDANSEIFLLQEDESATETESKMMSISIGVAQNTAERTMIELAMVKSRLSEMEAKKERLILSLQKSREEANSLENNQEAINVRLTSLAKRRSFVQRRLEFFSAKSASISATSDGDGELDAELRLPTLSWAARNGHLRVVQGCLAFGTADLEIKSGPNIDTPLHKAVRCGHHATALALLDWGADLESTDVAGETPLFGALQAKNEQIVHLLVEKGANVNAKNKRDETPLLKALRAENEQAMNLLIDKGAIINARDNMGRLPLHLAAMYGVDFAVRVFLAKGIDIEVEDGSLNTVLHTAARNGRVSTVEILLKNHAVVDARNKDSLTPLHLAAAFGYEAISALLLKSGADANAKGSLAYTPLHCACQEGFLAVAGLLIDKGVDIDARTSGDHTPLTLATKKEHADVVELLVKKRARMTSNKGSMSPLHWAASRGNEAILQILFQGTGPISLNSLNQAGQSPLDCALKNNHTSAEKYLRAHGAKESSKIGHNAVDDVQTQKRSSVSQSNALNGSRPPALPSPTYLAERQSVSIPKQTKSPTSNVFDKVLKRRKAT